jgi:hypothetical protein
MRSSPFSHLGEKSGLAAEVPSFSQAALRWAIFNARHNGLAPALVRIGTRVLIDKAEFELWVFAHRDVPGAVPTAKSAKPTARRRSPVYSTKTSK